MEMKFGFHVCGLYQKLLFRKVNQFSTSNSAPNWTWSQAPVLFSNDTSDVLSFYLFYIYSNSM